MNRSVARLIDAVRAMRTFTPPGDAHGTVRLACEAKEFPSVVTEIHRALQEVDASAALTESADGEKLRRGMLAAIQWVGRQGLDLADFEREVLSAISEKPKPQKAFRFLPSLSTGMKRGTMKARGTARIGRLRTFRKVEDLLGAKADMQAVQDVMGDALVSLPAKPASVGPGR